MESIVGCHGSGMVGLKGKFQIMIIWVLKKKKKLI
jgi:hypothetical protein